MNQLQRETAGQQSDEVVLSGTQVEAMRQGLHELANILTGVMIAAGLLSESVGEGKMRQSAAGLYRDCERGRQLVWRLREPLVGDGSEPDEGPEPAGLGSGQGSRFSAAAGERGEERNLECNQECNQENEQVDEQERNRRQW